MCACAHAADVGRRWNFVVGDPCLKTGNLAMLIILPLAPDWRNALGQLGIAARLLPSGHPTRL